MSCVVMTKIRMIAIKVKTSAIAEKYPILFILLKQYSGNNKVKIIAV